MVSNPHPVPLHMPDGKHSRGDSSPSSLIVHLKLALVLINLRFKSVHVDHVEYCPTACAAELIDSISLTTIICDLSMSERSIQAFNPLRTQLGSNRKWHTKLQEIIYYGESRFRTILAAITAPGHQQEWKQHCLHEELVCIVTDLAMFNNIFLLLFSFL